MTDLFIVSGLAALVWFGALHQALYDNWAAAIFFGVITFLSVIFLGASLIDKRRIRIPMAYPLIIFLITLALSLRHSFDYAAALWDAWGWGYSMLAYILYVNTGQRHSERRLLISMSGAVILFLTYLSIHQVIHFIPHDFMSYWGRVSATLVNSNVLAGFCLFWIFPLFLETTPLPIDYASRAAVITLLFMSGSWAAWIALLLGGLFLLRHHPRFSTFAGAVFLGALLMTVLKLSPWISSNAKQTNRLSYFKAAVHMVEKEPVTGVGLSGYAMAYPYFKEPNPIESTRLAHSFPLQIMAETGLLGTFAVMLLVFLWVKAYARSTWSIHEELDQEPYKAALIAVFSYSLVSISMDYLLNRYALFLFLALLAPRKNSCDLVIERDSLKAIGIAALLCMTPFWLTLFRAEQFFAQGSYRQALELNPHLGDAWAGLATTTQNPEQARSLRLTAWHWKKNRDFLLANIQKKTS